jgi:hypothetical protein
VIVIVDGGVHDVLGILDNGNMIFAVEKDTLFDVIGEFYIGFYGLTSLFQIIEMLPHAILACNGISTPRAGVRFSFDLHIPLISDDNLK